MVETGHQRPRFDIINDPVLQPALLGVVQAVYVIVATSITTDICWQLDQERIPVCGRAHRDPVNRHLVPPHVLSRCGAREDASGGGDQASHVVPEQPVLKIDHVHDVVHPTDCLVRVQRVRAHVTVLRGEQRHPVGPVPRKKIVALTVLVLHQILSTCIISIDLINGMVHIVEVAARPTTPRAVRVGISDGVPACAQLGGVAGVRATPGDVTSWAVIDLVTAQPTAPDVHRVRVVCIENAPSPRPRLDIVKVVKEIGHGRTDDDAN
mmetsp:Transcript_59303/g.157894  ORF Transcript_59303/g.157894 Transcript_59303/m.157894 type:complete len:266 (+) Transcript_59303:305-1102(+)